MNKKEVLQVIRNPRSLNEVKMREVEKMAADYPYFQGAHTLVAIGHERFKNPKSKLSLTRAALYSTDRRFLRDLIQSVTTEEYKGDSLPPAESASVSTEATEAEVAAQEEVAVLQEEAATVGTPPAVAPVSTAEPASTAEPVAEKEITIDEPAPDVPEVTLAPKKSKFHVAEEFRDDVEERDLNEVLYLSHDELLKEVFLNLEELKKSKSQYLEVEKQLEDAEFEEAQANAVKKATKNQQRAGKAEIEPKTRKSKTPKETKQTEQPVENGDPVVKKVKQNEIIEEFIKKNPSIKTQTGEGAKPAPVDLSAPSQKLKDDLVTENLALIYIKQERKDKAIQVYKKLILKFPQKKSYFAAQIKELQK